MHVLDLCNQSRASSGCTMCRRHHAAKELTAWQKVQSMQHRGPDSGRPATYSLVVERPRSVSVALAALRPGRPLTLPPGWVVEPVR